MALGWILKRSKPVETALAAEALDAVRDKGAIVPSLWYAEVGNALLLAERQRVITAAESSSYLASLRYWQIDQDTASPAVCQPQVVQLGRLYRLTAYDATYLELALRRGLPLATFDAPLANALRQAGGQVFGDAA